MFEDEDIGVHHTSTARRGSNSNDNQLRVTSLPSLSSYSFAASFSDSHPVSLSSTAVPFTSKRRAIQFANRSVDELEGDRIEADNDSTSPDDDIDFTPTDTSSSHTDYPSYARRFPVDQPAGRPSRRHPTVERSPHCQPLDRSVNKPFVCIYPYTLTGRRVDRRDGLQEDEANGAGGGGGGERDRCGQEFGTRQACENHIRGRHTFEKLKCSFPNCGFSSTDVQNLNKHERSHVSSNTLSMQPKASEGALRMRLV